MDNQLLHSTSWNQQRFSSWSRCHEPMRSRTALQQLESAASEAQRARDEEKTREEKGKALYETLRLAAAASG
jgi:hypothetical protein